MYIISQFFGILGTITIIVQICCVMENANRGLENEAAMESSSSSDASMRSLDRLYLAGAHVPPRVPFDPEASIEPEHRLDLAAVTAMVHGRLLRDLSIGELQAAYQCVTMWRDYHRDQRRINGRGILCV